MKNMNSVLNVVYAANENYAPLVWVSVKSLLEHNYKCFGLIKVYLISDGIKNDSLDKIEQVIKEFDGELIVIDINAFDQYLRNIQLLFAGGKTSYARLFIGEKISEEKILYLDCDTYVNNSLLDLWETDISQYYVAGVQDIVVPRLRLEVDLLVDDPYINAGIMLINLDKWRKDSISEQFINYIVSKEGSVPCHDQGTINHVCKGNILVLPCRYNVMTPLLSMKGHELKNLYDLADYYSDEEVSTAVKKPAIIHFTAGWFIRPWFSNSNHPYRDKFIDLYSMSPWKNVLLKKGKLNRKSFLMKVAYSIVPFGLYSKLVKWKRQK